MDTPRVTPFVAAWLFRRAGLRGLILTGTSLALTLGLAWLFHHFLGVLLKGLTPRYASLPYGTLIQNTVVALITAPASIVSLLLPWSLQLRGVPLSFKSAAREFPVLLRNFCQSTGLALRVSLPFLLPGIAMAFLFLRFGNNAEAETLYATLLLCCIAVCGSSLFRVAHILVLPLLSILLKSGPAQSLTESRTYLIAERLKLTFWIAGTAGITYGGFMVHSSLAIGALMLGLFLCSAQTAGILLRHVQRPEVEPSPPHPPVLITRAYVIDEDKG